MEQSYASCTQRVDLLDYYCEKAGNKKRAYRAIMCRSSQRKAPAMLLARLPSSQAKGEKMVLT